MVKSITDLTPINQSIIDGKLIEGQSKKILEVVNPYDGEVIQKINLLNEFQVIKAIKSSKKAQEKWSDLRPQERRTILHNWKDHNI